MKLRALTLSAAVTPDTLSTSKGKLKITPIKHASVMLEFGGKVIHIDPWSQGDYTGLPKADVILITDVHGDHMDPAKIAEIKSRDGDCGSRSCRQNRDRSNDHH
jgi:L-ascorbate metabolism protein UlaG (beta-lactamase superfamily)